MSTQLPGQNHMSKAVLRKVLQIARPKISARLKHLGNQIQTALKGKTSQKIHLKIDFLKDNRANIEVSSAGLLALEYGRQQINGEGVVSEVMSELRAKKHEVSHDE